MAYINQTQDPRRHATAIAVVVAVHTALALALLSMGVVATTEIKPTWDPFVLTPDPKPQPPPKPKPIPESNDTVFTAPATPFDKLKPADESLVEVHDQFLDDWPIGGDNSFVEQPIPTPVPSPTFKPKAPIPANNQAKWITTNDYPARPLRDGVEGVAEYRVVIGSNGLVSSCEITQSTGDGTLDQTTCRLISRKARFQAATDESGASVVGTYTGKVRWDIPD